MEEKRLYFRMKNNGEMHAYISKVALEVLENSSNGALVIKKNIHLPVEGIIEIHINNFTTKVRYEILRADNDALILVFINEDEINALFVVLKHLRDERKRKARKG